MTIRDNAILVLEDGTFFTGSAYAGRGESLGEIVFSTGMTGYQETFTDPSYHRQIIVMTAPHIGNTGVNEEDPESGGYWAAGVVVRDPARRASNWRSTAELEDSLAQSGIVGICDVDTRAITRHLREAGVMRAGIFSGDALPHGAYEGNSDARDKLLDIVRSSPQMAGADLACEVSTKEPYTIEAEGKQVATVVALDLGIKSRTPAHLASRGVKVIVLPATATFDDITSHNPDGVFFSNGPGDPETADAQVELLRAILEAGYPFFGICFGNQILGRALGYGTYKLEYGHRGINQPVLDRATGKVEVTAHNHGFAVDVPREGTSVAPYDGGKFGRVEVSHIGLNDNVVEGLRCLDIPAFSVQYHPEAAAGPHDASYLFDRYIAMMLDTKAQKGQADA